MQDAAVAALIAPTEGSEEEKPVQYKALDALMAHGDDYNSPEFLASLDAMVPHEILPLKAYFEQYSKKGLNNYCASAITEIAANLNRFDADDRMMLCHNLLESENSSCI